MAKSIPKIKQEYDKQVKRIRSILSDIESVGMEVDFILPEEPEEIYTVHVQSLKRITPKELYKRTSFKQNGITIDVPETVARKAVKDFKLTGIRPSLNSIATSSTQPIPTPDGGTTIPKPDIDIPTEERSEQVSPDEINIIDEIRSRIDDLPPYAEYHGYRSTARNAWIRVDNTGRIAELRSMFDSMVENYTSAGNIGTLINYLKNKEHDIFSLFASLIEKPPSDEEEYERAFSQLASLLLGRSLTQEESISMTPQEGMYFHE